MNKDEIESLGTYPDENTLRILITTDNHVGYNETDPIVGDDSWKTFDEILAFAKRYNVDMILQSGDLFHVNKPSKKALYHVMKSLRVNCFGDKPCELELLSDPSLVFLDDQFNDVNYEDPNLNVAIPLFSISGNHDDASGEDLLCAMDILHVSGLVNHFGKTYQNDNIELNPLLFQKGDTKIALYGLNSIRDERLFRTFKDGHVKFNVPTLRQDEWFNILCVHQNHTGHTNTAFLPEQFLPDFLDLVIWGHEHECIPNFIHNPSKNFDVLQPGSSVATSLCDAESKPKFIFILEIKPDKTTKLIPIPLKTTRPFIMRDISLNNVPNLKPMDKVGISKFLTTKVEEMIAEANDESKEYLLQQDLTEEEISEKLIPLPLIRLRVDYSHNSSVSFLVENPRRFSNKFVGKLANPNNVVQFYKKKREQMGGRSKINKSKSDLDFENLVNGTVPEDIGIETLVNSLLNNTKLSLLPEIGMHDAIKKFVDKDEKNALKSFIETEVENEVKVLSKNKDFLQTDNIDDLKKLLRQVKVSIPSTNIKASSDTILDKSLPTALKEMNGSDIRDSIITKGKQIETIHFDDDRNKGAKTRRSITDANSLVENCASKKENLPSGSLLSSYTANDLVLMSSNDAENEDYISSKPKLLLEEDTTIKEHTVTKKDATGLIGADISTAHITVDDDEDLFLYSETMPSAVNSQDIILSDGDNDLHATRSINLKNKNIITNNTTLKTANTITAKISNSRKKNIRNTQNSNIRSSQTPKTDILQSLLAKRRK
ncbi:related to Double-strand break repair protein MRE11 [Saccharomycodes ludwigii]|uniref:Related to Double-strand break repair protein MRE11 n=1 Tax=Saccharomycodes ludwigii TaxID=36035 RepID=A0A376B4W5_9ASCO|nr:hypothetical protein SCDLUD_000401 [Saccharomycodes ludwigii]KAH3902810.1 hypothetical protein SCDLUD_000401 [Saccharomycodes ludwigii]SSD59736.1 related to Double-strand break repair protein MRE11 [Saccharomycodes ludwigii]